MLLRLFDIYLTNLVQEEEKKGGKKGRLLGIITLSDVLRYVIGEVAIGEAAESMEESSSSADKASSTSLTSLLGDPSVL